MKISKNSILQIILCSVITVASLSGTALYGASVSSEYKIALDYFNNGDFDIAINVWSKILSERESELSTVQKIALKQRLDYAIFKQKMKKTEEEAAAKALKPQTTMNKAIETFERACRMAASKANKDLAAGQFERVLKLIQKAYDEGFVSKDQAYYQAYCLVALDRLDEVPTILNTAIENNPASAEPLNLLVVYLDKIGNTEQKLITLRKSLKLDPDQPETEYRLVTSLIATKSRKNLREAGTVAVKAVRGNEEKARVLAKLFPKSVYKERLEQMATEIAIDAKRKEMRAEMEANGRVYKGPSLKVTQGGSSGSASSAETSNSNDTKNGGNNGNGGTSQGGGTPAPAPAK